MSFPINEFKTQEQLDDCLQEWKTRLFLTDWTIKAKVVPQSELGEGKAGENRCADGLQCSVIKISELSESHEECIQKSPMELTLIHELLHCCDDPVEIENMDYEQAFFVAKRHTQLEKMAKSLLMAKYNLSFEWFTNH